MATDTANKTTTSDELYEKQMTLAEQVAAEQRRIAEQAANYKRQSLADQLTEQRRQYSKNLQTIGEQSYGQGNRLLSGLANRGLGTSGLLQLGDVQTQMAKGQSLSDLAYQDRIGAENIRTEQRQVGSDLAAALRQSELDKQSSILGAEETLYGRQQAELQRQQEIATTLLQYGIDAGSLGSDDALTLYSQLLGATTAEELAEVQSGELYQQAVSGSDDVLGQQQFSGKFDDYISQDAQGNWSLASKSGGLNLDISKFVTFDAEAGAQDQQYYFDAEGINTSLKEKYKGFDNYDNINVEYIRSSSGSRRNKPFSITLANGRTSWYSTWNEASAAYDEAYGG